MTLTVRDMVKAIQLEARAASDLTPDRASELLLELTSLLGNIAEEQRTADALYSQVLMDAYEKEGKANRATLRAECSVEYLRKREAKDTFMVATELIKSLKVVLRTKQEEMRLTR